MQACSQVVVTGQPAPCLVLLVTMATPTVTLLSFLPFRQAAGSVRRSTMRASTPISGLLRRMASPTHTTATWLIIAQVCTEITTLSTLDFPSAVSAIINQWTVNSGQLRAWPRGRALFCPVFLVFRMVSTTSCMLVTRPRFSWWATREGLRRCGGKGSYEISGKSRAWISSSVIPVISATTFGLRPLASMLMAS